MGRCAYAAYAQEEEEDAAGSSVGRRLSDEGKAFLPSAGGKEFKAHLSASLLLLFLSKLVVQEEELFTGAGI